ncbi:MAG: hypothetical protein H6733_17155 [Alphaproteobacteria bacterium]|nr:hypothetical protein [Alphaproteobacteria bacterium]
MRFLPLLLAAAAAPALATEPTVLLRTGAAVGPHTVQDLSLGDIDDAGRWRVIADTAGGRVVVAASGPSWAEGSALPSSDTVASVVGLDTTHARHATYQLTAAPSGDHVVVQGTTEVVRTGDAITAQGTSPGTSVASLGALATLSSGQVWSVVTDDTGRKLLLGFGGPSTLDPQVMLYREGDFHDVGTRPRIQAIADDPRLLAAGPTTELAYVVDFAVPPAVDACIGVGATLPACTGDAAPLPGATYAAFDHDGALALNAHDRLLARSEVSGTGSNRAILALDDTLVAAVSAHQAGTPPGTTLQSLGAGRIGLSNADVTAFWAQWDDPDPAASAGIFVGGSLYVVDGQTLPGVGTVAHWHDDLVLSHNGTWLLLAADLTDGSTVALRYDLSDQLRVIAPVPTLAGGINTFLLATAAPGHRVVLAGSPRRGTTPLPGACAGASVGLARPTALGMTTALAYGNGLFQVPIPLAAAGRTIYVQAVDVDACAVSEVVEVTLQ